MAKDRTETGLKVVPGTVDGNFLAEHVEQDHSLEGMEPYRIFPRFKIVQSSSEAELKDKFPEKTVMLRPGDSVVLRHDAKDGESFSFVPHFFFVEFTKMSDRRDTDAPMILERSFDPDSRLAVCARDKEKRHEIYEGDEDKPDKKQKKYRYVEHLRFPGMIYGNSPLAGVPVVLSFEKGEFGQGRNFISAIKLRRMRVDDAMTGVPLWAQVWDLTVGLRQGTEGQWYGFDFTPSESPMIAPEHVEEMRGYHMDLLQAHNSQRIRVDGDEEDPAKNPEEGVPESAEEGGF